MGTRLYKENLESYVQGRGMTGKTKVRIMVTVTVLMSIGFIMMHQVPVGRIVLGGVCDFSYRLLPVWRQNNSCPAGAGGGINLRESAAEGQESRLTDQPQNLKRISGPCAATA